VTDHEHPSSTARNRLLMALDGVDRDLLMPHMERLHMDVGTVVVKAGVPFTHVYFPENAILSVVNYMEDGTGVEVGTVGNEGMAGLPAYLEAEASEGETFCQHEGACLRALVGPVIVAAAESPGIRRLLNRYTQAYMTQVAQSAACNRLHSIEQRCARWLLMTHDRMVGPTDLIHLKHDFLALMLGVRRAGVTIAAGALQDSGLIRYRRGAIRVLDRPGLEAASCECYGIVRRHFDRLLS
jgi:CRP-like cAMP-binding protein